MEILEQRRIGNNAKETNSLDSSKGEITVKNISIPRSEFSAKWIKDEGYSVGLEGVRLSKDYNTLEEALNEIGYGVENEDELVKVGEVNYDMVVKIVRALMIVKDNNDGK